MSALKPPENQEAERSALGAILIGAGAELVASFTTELGLRPEHFYRPRHGSIFEAMIGLVDGREPVDVLTVCAELDRRGSLEGVGGKEYVHSLPNLVPAAAHARTYAKEVRHTAWLRAQAAIFFEMAEAATLGELDRLARLEGELASAGDTRGRARPTREQRQHDLSEHVQRGALDLPQWPWPTLNELTGGIWPGQLTILAGITSHGKSVIADQVLEQVVRRDPSMRCALYPNEMGTLERDLRSIARNADLPLKRLMLAKLSGGELSQFVKGVEQLPAYDIVPAAGMGARELAREMHRQRLDVMVIDLLNGLPGSSRVEEIDENVRTLATAAAESGCHVIACQHLNRNRIVGAYPPEPTLGDIRGSGQIADLAHNVMFIYRKERVVVKDGEKIAINKPGDEAFLDLAKGRNGILGLVKLQFNGGRMRFHELAEIETTRSAAA